jgi:hypothetical protein
VVAAANKHDGDDGNRSNDGETDSMAPLFKLSYAESLSHLAHP